MSTIAAVATPLGAAGIGVIRISGEEAFAVADRVFQSVRGTPLCDQSGYSALFGHIFEDGKVLDEAVALVFRAPKSYTGENVVELSCHGGAFVLKRVLRAVLAAGAVPAKAGEFTRRAFLNGKLDLSEAEAVMTLIASSGEEALSASLTALDGALSREIDEIRAELSRTSAFFAAWVDYPDEEIPELSDDALLKVITEARLKLKKLLQNFDAGQAVTGGVDSVIVGRPNVGKSTLLNLLSGCERAIVTPVAGTTRDVVEVAVRLGNAELRLADTAGIRSETGDEIEKIGVERAKTRLARAKLVLAVVDGSALPTEDDRALLALCKKEKTILLLNKSDLGLVSQKDLSGFCAHVLPISAKSGTGLDKLCAAVEEVLGTVGFDTSAPLLITERQRLCAESAEKSLAEAESGIIGGITPDAVNVCIDDAIGSLGILTGESATDAVLDEVFKNFCVGK